MTIEEAVAWYAGILCALLVPLAQVRHTKG